MNPANAESIRQWAVEQAIAVATKDDTFEDIVDGAARLEAFVRTGEAAPVYAKAAIENAFSEAEVDLAGVAKAKVRAVRDFVFERLGPQLRGGL